MLSAKIAITLDQQLLRLVDRWVNQGRYASRSQAIQSAIREKLERWKRSRLADEVKRLNPKEERMLAEENFNGEQWPEY